MQVFPSHFSTAIFREILFDDFWVFVYVLKPVGGAGNADGWEPSLQWRRADCPRYRRGTR